jgi:hypothetical protein
MQKKSVIPIDTIRIKTDGKVYEKTSNGWKLSKKEFPEAQHVIKLFKTNHHFHALIDKKNPQFLKGQLSSEGMVQGARINILPDGEVLDKAYSLFAKHLSIHDEATHGHWDVIYQNPNGKYAYLYTLRKRKKAIQKKYSHVEEFGRIVNRLEKNILAALQKKNDSEALSLYTLIKTCMRVGNTMYYKINGHQGLTTLKKEDIKIIRNSVTFSYPGKDGVPLQLSETFPPIYIKRIREVLLPLNKNSFIFVNAHQQPYKDTDLQKAFKKFCGIAFYPHIVRSYYATITVQNFLANHTRATKEEIAELFTSIAQKLGHKKYVKKDHAWVDSYTTTIHHYIQPDLVEKVERIVR